MLTGYERRVYLSEIDQELEVEDEVNITVVVVGTGQRV
jgi:hypothetical protein